MDVHPAALTIERLLEDCVMDLTRRGGPGGQHRNKVESAVVLTHLPSSVTGQASERRSQHENRKMAIHRLRLNLAVGVRSCIGLDGQPSVLWRARVRSRKISVSVDHLDFPALLSEALDALQAMEWEVAVASERLGISSSQLVKLLKVYPPAFQKCNEARQASGKNRLN